MPLYLTISQGTRPDTSTPLLACSDQRVIAAALDALGSLREDATEVKPDDEPRAATALPQVTRKPQ